MNEAKPSSPSRGIANQGHVIDMVLRHLVYQVPMALSLLIGGPLSGQYREMPEDRMVEKVARPDGRPATYTRMRVSNENKETEVWGWAPLCYRKVKSQYLRLMEC